MIFEVAEPQSLVCRNEIDNPLSQETICSAGIINISEVCGVRTRSLRNQRAAERPNLPSPCSLSRVAPHALDHTAVIGRPRFMCWRSNQSAHRALVFAGLNQPTNLVQRRTGNRLRVRGRFAKFYTLRSSPRRRGRGRCNSVHPVKRCLTRERALSSSTAATGRSLSHAEPRQEHEDHKGQR